MIQLRCNSPYNLFLPHNLFFCNPWIKEMKSQQKEETVYRNSYQKITNSPN